jgi:hypothetical protein
MYIEMGILFATIVGLGMTWITAPIYSTPSPTTRTSGPVIDDISCDSMEHLNMHIHAHLDIFYQW